MNWVSVVLQVLLKLPKLMEIAEQAFDGIPDSGAEKKKMVMTVFKIIVGAVLGISTGGQKETWAAIEKFVSPIIDIICSFIFPHEEEIKEEPK